MIGLVLSLLFLVASYGLGYILLSFLPTLYTRPLKDYLSLIIGLVLNTLLIFWSSWILGFSILTILLIVAVENIIFTSFVFKQKEALKLKLNLPQKTYLQIIFHLMIFSVISWFWSRLFFVNQNGLQAGWRTIWGDWAVHLSYATSFAYGDNFPPEFSILSGTRLSYPFMTDFLSAIFLKLQLSLTQAFILPSIIFSLASIYTFYHLGTKIYNSKTAVIGLSLFFLSGGLGFWVVNQPENWLRLSAIRQPIAEFTSQPDYHIYWINKTTSEIIPQRSFLMALPLVLFGYSLAWQVFQSFNRKMLIAATLIISLLPLIHAHSFIALIGVFGWTFLLRLFQKKLSKKELGFWVSCLLVIILVGGGQLAYFYTDTVASEGFFNKQVGWMAQKDEGTPWIGFWVKNVGITFILAVFGFIFTQRKQQLFFLAYWIIFIAGNVYLFQPYEYDNTKAFTHWYIAACLNAGYFVYWVTKSKEKGYRLLLGIFITLLIYTNLSGILDVWSVTKGRSQPMQMANPQQIKMAEWAKNNTPPDAIFITNQSHNHWVPMLSGRKIVMGFGGWLWSYNLNYYQREIDIKDFYTNPEENRSVLDKYNVDYIVLGPEEIGSFKAKVETFDMLFKKAHQDKEYRIYRYTSLP